MTKSHEILKTIGTSTINQAFSNIVNNSLGVVSLGFLSGVMQVRNQKIADELINRLENAEIELDNELIKSNEFLGFTSKVLIALSTASKNKKISFLLDVYIKWHFS